MRSEDYKSQYLHEREIADPPAEFLILGLWRSGGFSLSWAAVSNWQKMMDKKSNITMTYLTLTPSLARSSAKYFNLWMFTCRVSFSEQYPTCRKKIICFQNNQFSSPGSKFCPWSLPWGRPRHGPGWWTCTGRGPPGPAWLQCWKVRNSGALLYGDNTELASHWYC